MKTVVLIPSRLNSTRLPGKALLDIGGLPMVVRVYKQAVKCIDVNDVFVCTDSVDIAKVVQSHGGKVIMTSSNHENGTTRIAEAKSFLPKYDLYLDVQGDEPFINPDHISSVIECHIKFKPDIVLPILPITDTKASDVKVVTDINGRVLYLSRSKIPFHYNKSVEYFKHLSIISFSPDSLDRYARLTLAPLESIEGVELLRAIENGMYVQTIKLTGDSFSIDTSDDLERALKRVEFYC
jgi:3-deoxy-manno-octulosonate cytidylyltransferase (CMP-KDO synthetase)